MNARPRWIHGPMLLVMLGGLLTDTGTTANGAGGGHGGGHGGGGRAPRVSAPRQANNAPRMPHASAPAHMNVAGGQMRSNGSHARASSAQARTNNAQGQAHNTQAWGNNSQARVNNSQAIGSNTQLGMSTAPNRLSTNPASTAIGSNTQLGMSTAPNRLSTNPASTATAGGTGVPVTAAAINARSSLSGNVTPAAYTYGIGNGARNYRAYGYGAGYRNRYYGRGYGYGRSQGNNRAIVGRLRSVHASLARLDHDYQGHRARAMHAISMAIRQLSHRSMVYNGVGFAGMNNGMGMGMGRGMRASALGGGGRRGLPMSQAQSDARMSQALRSLQGISMQLANQGSSTMGHSRALGHVQWAGHELTVALSIR
jgi:hypothetical protein